MHRTPLYQFHVDHGAKMVDFAGWEMPISYGSIMEEHRQVRDSGGVFDVSHMGRLRISGRHARRFLERLCTRRVSDMAEGQARYTLFCNERGGVRDDGLVYRLDDDEFELVVNASNREKILEHIERIKGDMVFKLKDRTFDTAMVALQGPAVMDHISKVSSEIPTLKKYRFTVKNLLVMKLIVSRTGYTGEDGIEATLPAKGVNQVLGLLMKNIDMDAPDAPIKPAGLGARDTLRMEAGMPLYGHELTEDRNALCCGVGFAINMDKDGDERGEPFIGLDALRAAEKEGAGQKIVGLMVEGRRTARADMPVKKGDDEVGVVTSACMSPTLGRPIAMAMVDAAHSEPGATLQIDTGKATLEAEVTKLPFYKAPKKP